jgi:hypothetical protein
VAARRRRDAFFDVDLGPGRGYGSGVFPFYGPDPGTHQQALGYSEWKDGVRTFTPHAAFGAINYFRTTVEGKGTWTVLYAHVGFEGVDAFGATSCRILGANAESNRVRQDGYDPTWVDPRPSETFIDSGASPTFTDPAPTSDLVTAAQAGPDPGGAPPIFQTSLPPFAGSGAANATDCGE